MEPSVALSFLLFVTFCPRGASEGGPFGHRSSSSFVKNRKEKRIFHSFGSHSLSSFSLVCQQVERAETVGPSSLPHQSSPILLLALSSSKKEEKSSLQCNKV